MSDMNIKDSDLSLKRLADMLPKVEPPKKMSFEEAVKNAPKDPPPIIRIPVEKRLNIAIYEGFTMSSHSPELADAHYKWITRVKKRVHELFDVEDGFESDIYRLGFEYIDNVLIEDAIKNNTRDFLPDELISEYDRRVVKK